MRFNMPATTLDRWWAKTLLLPTGCLLWLGYRDRDGYGQIKAAGRVWQAHRYGYHALHGFDTGLELDHRCKNRWCVNPDHLEPVTRQENESRKYRLLCRNGHPRKQGTRCAQCDLTRIRKVG